MMIIIGLVLALDRQGGGIWTDIIHFVGVIKVGLFSLLLLSKNKFNFGWAKHMLWVALIVQTLSVIATIGIDIALVGFNIYITANDIFNWLLILFILIYRLDEIVVTEKLLTLTKKS
jgi:hypothetical protein